MTNRVVDVVIPTLRMPHAFNSLALLRHIPWPINLLLIPEGKSWAEAVNLGLAEVHGNDVILMDDDVFLWPETFRDFRDLYDRADVFGFKLLYPDKTIQHAGGYYENKHILHFGSHEKDNGQFDEARYTCHVTTSLCYIKNVVLKTIGLMATDYPGMQFEDVDFNMRALKAGFRLLYTGQPATHMESASKQYLPGFIDGLRRNESEIQKRYFDDAEFVKRLATFPKPL